MMQWQGWKGKCFEFGSFNYPPQRLQTFNFFKSSPWIFIAEDLCYDHNLIELEPNFQTSIFTAANTDLISLSWTLSSVEDFCLLSVYSVEERELCPGNQWFCTLLIGSCRACSRIQTWVPAIAPYLVIMIVLLGLSNICLECELFTGHKCWASPQNRKDWEQK